MYEMYDAPIWELMLRLFGACLLGGAVGYQREVHGRPAGLRTHILVCVGATLFTITSIMFGRGGDPSRIASNIVTGIGFLGAGTIIRQGSTVRGLTTAASLWGVAAIGLAVGMGGQMYILAAVAALLMLAVLSWVDILENRLMSTERYVGLSIILGGQSRDAEPIISALTGLDAQVLGVKNEMDEDGRRVIRLRLKFQAHVSQERISTALAKLETIHSFDWE